MTEPAVPTRRPVVTWVICVGAIAAIVVVGLAWPRGSWHRSGAPLAVSGWAPYWQTDEALASFEANADLFSDVSLVAYSATDATTIATSDNLPATALGALRAAATAHRVPLLATIVDASTKGTMAAVLANPSQRAAHISTIVNLIREGNFDGVDLDYEKFAFADDRATWAATRPNWVRFLTELGAALHPLGKQLVVSVPPSYDAGRTADSGYWVYDIAAIAKVVDRIRVMAYDYSTSEPGPIAPIRWVERVAAASAKLAPPDKIDLGIPAYGYDWVAGVAGTCPTDQTPKRQSISTVRAQRELAARAQTPTRNTTTAELQYDYSVTLTGVGANGATVSCTVARTVRFLDAQALHQRAYVADRQQLHGVSVWALGGDDAATWQGLRAAQRNEPVWPSVTTPAS